MDADDITEIAARLLRAPFALFAGAGFSRSAGIPVAGELQEYALRRIGFSDEDLACYWKAALPFETFFEVLLSATDCTCLFPIFELGKPTRNHVLAAHLARIGILRIIVTTNFDTHMECALREQGVAFHEYSSDESLGHINWDCPELVLIKLHGTVSDQDSVAITIRRVAAQQHITNRARAISEVFAHLPRGGLFIFGYSFSDRFDISPAIRMIPRLSAPVLCINHLTGGDTHVCRVADELPSHPLAVFDAQLLTCNADDLITGAWKALCITPPSSPAVPQSGWQAHIDEWLATVRVSGDGMAGYVAGLMHKAANNWIRSNALLAGAVKDGLPPTIAARAHLAMGNNAFDHGEFDAATESLMRGLQVAREHKQLQEEARALNSIGMVAAARLELDLAREHYERALALSKKVGDRELEGKCLGNLGIAIKNQGGPLHEAIALQEQALGISRELGDKRSEGRTLGNLGILQSCLGNKMGALPYYKQAGQVARDLGDQLHVGIWRHNYGEDACESDPLQAEQALHEAAEIFRSLGQERHATRSEALLTALAARRASATYPDQAGRRTH
jgi:tetratricopeptide (TPR) repeat protein